MVSPERKRLAQQSNNRGTRSVIWCAALAASCAVVIVFTLRPSLALTTPAVFASVDESIVLPTTTVPALNDVDIPRPKKENSFQYTEYVPASTEKYLVDHAVELGYDVAGKNKNANTCIVWKDPHATAAPVHHDLHAHLADLSEYKRLLNDFKAVPDVRLKLDEPGTCDSVELHPDGLSAIFPSGQLSKSASGYVEPLISPLRHPDRCGKRGGRALMDLSYLVHDFGEMCRQLKPTSRIVLVDMGASLEFHSRGRQPAVYLVELFRKFGFPFDHIYAFEVTPTEPAQVFEKLPANLMSAYHWINVGVSADPESKLNPLKMIVENYNEDDLVIVKLDIDTSSIEVPLAKQLLEDSRYHKLIDHFYFEHHVHTAEFATSWRSSMQGSFKESLDLFHGLRQAGIAAHSWV